MYPPPSFCKRISGFTLIEMAMVTLIGGIIMASAGTAMTSFLDQARIDTTRIRMEGIENALRQYLNANNKYPCPARLNAQQDNANYGIEINIDCLNAPVNVGETARVRGRDIDGAGPLPPQNIRVGAVPVRSLNLPDTYMTDGWGNRFWFVMTEELGTQPPPLPGPPPAPGAFPSDRGGVVLDDSQDGGVFVTDEAQYAIISPGPNRIGAFNMAGIQAFPCPPELPAAGGSLEASNCNFQNPPGTAPKRFRSTLNVATATGPQTYDDYVTFRTSADADTALPPCPVNMVRVGDVCQLLPAAPPNCGPNQVRVGADCRDVPVCTVNQLMRKTATNFICVNLPNCTGVTVLKYDFATDQFSCVTPSIPATPSGACPNTWQVRRWDGSAWICTEPPQGTWSGRGVVTGGTGMSPSCSAIGAATCPGPWTCRPGYIAQRLVESTPCGMGMCSFTNIWACVKN